MNECHLTLMNASWARKDLLNQFNKTTFIGEEVIENEKIDVGEI